MEKEMEQQMGEIMAARKLISKYAHGFMESMALKCVVELGIVDILHKHTKPMTLQELASGLSLPTVDMNRFQRLMRFVVHYMGLFTLDNKNGTYGLTHCSQCLLQDGESFMPPMILHGITDWMIGPWYSLSKSIQGGPTPFEMYHGVNCWDYLASHPDENRMFNEGQAAITREIIGVIVRQYGSWLFEGIGSIVDVGGGNGAAAKKIVKKFPNIKCTVLDLPHVIRGNSEKSNSEVEWVEGDMFLSVPHADTILLKYILHDWGDDDCVKILQRCKEAIPSEGGKVIIVEMVVEINPAETDISTMLTTDMFMMVNTGGKERTKEEWEKLIRNAGFSKCKITPVLAIASVIEAYA
ncbi:(RS)-norcoclaurine 6-O-methyltransferase-like [Macadamia integrifolia]|uniref:(RS)-norcoclaurine 6-O-methyltransferase-like n=1 Tax=Macadamia integrifolia TaxID=60698 RepID=UPI001C4F209A|nr:(RS)-norcoclaurine 6-O-methyltransferase-like [Macadamia integrifolia]